LILGEVGNVLFSKMNPVEPFLFIKKEAPSGFETTEKFFDKYRNLTAMGKT